MLLKAIFLKIFRPFAIINFSEYTLKKWFVTINGVFILYNILYCVRGAVKHLNILTTVIPTKSAVNTKQTKSYTLCRDCSDYNNKCFTVSLTKCHDLQIFFHKLSSWLPVPTPLR